MASASIKGRKDISIPFAGEQLAAWLYPSGRYDASTKGPAIILAHGLGGTKEMRLDVFADEFNQEGYTCVVFDYRYSGGSTGLPRGLINWSKQQEDWHAVIDYVRHLDFVDPERVGLFGTSFSGGHVIQVAAADVRLKAVISQCPFTDGLSSAFTTGLSTLPGLVGLGLRDMLFGSDEHPVNVPLVGKPGEKALMNAHDAMEGYLRLVPAGFQRQAEVPARLIPMMPFLRPGRYASKVQCPIFFAICGKDTVAPPKMSLRYAAQASKGTVKCYDDMGHFDIYVGEPHERAFRDYKKFLSTHLPAYA